MTIKNLQKLRSDWVWQIEGDDTGYWGTSRYGRGMVRVEKGTYVCTVVVPESDFVIPVSATPAKAKKLITSYKKGA